VQTSKQAARGVKAAGGTAYKAELKKDKVGGQGTR